MSGKRASLLLFTIVLSGGCGSGGGGVQKASPVQRIEELRAPAFDDVSAFGEGDVARVDAWLEEQLELADYPALSVAVTRGGKVVYRGAVGYADLETRTGATPQTAFHVASVTKVFTTTLAVLLHEREPMTAENRNVVRASQ